MGLTTPVVCLSQPPSLTHLPVCFLVLQACTSALCSGYHSQQRQSKHCSSTSQVRACSEIGQTEITQAHYVDPRVTRSLVVCLPRYWNPNRMQLHRLSRSLSAAWHPQAGRNGECTLARYIVTHQLCTYRVCICYCSSWPCLCMCACLFTIRPLTCIDGSESDRHVFDRQARPWSQRRQTAVRQHPGTIHYCESTTGECKFHFV